MTPCGLRLKHIGTLIAQRRMPPLAFVSHFEVVDDQCGGLPPRFRRLLREAFIFEALEHPLHDRIIIAIPSVDSLIYTGYSYDCVFPGLCNEPAHKPECAFQIEL